MSFLPDPLALVGPLCTDRVALWLGRVIYAKLDALALEASSADEDRQLLGMFDALLPLAHEDRAALASWFMLLPNRWLRWVPATTYTPKGETGHYAICWSRIVSEMGLAWQATRSTAKEFRRATDAEAFTTLDSWLYAEREGLLRYEGERGGSATLPPAVQSSLRLASLRRAVRWPRACATCGDSFTPTRVNAKRCARCRTSSTR